MMPGIESPSEYAEIPHQDSQEEPKMAEANKTQQTAPAAAAKPTTGPAAAPRTESPAAQANRTQPFDFGQLTFADAPAPVRKSSRTSAPNPLVPVMKDSWSKRDDSGKGAGKSVTVPTAKAQELVNLVRYAANQLSEETGESIGSSIKATENANGTTTVVFAAKKRRNRRTGDAA